MNPALAIILQKSNGLQKEKTGNIVISENVSGDVPFTDLTSNQFIEGMRKIYELEPFIKLQPDDKHIGLALRECYKVGSWSH